MHEGILIAMDGDVTSDEFAAECTSGDRLLSASLPVSRNCLLRVRARSIAVKMKRESYILSRRK